MKKILIELSDEEYEKIQGGEDIEVPLGGMLIARDKRMSKIIREGTLLPEGYGRLIDVDDMIADLKNQCETVFKLDAVKPEDYYISKCVKFKRATWKQWCEDFCDWANKRKTIIEADREEAV